MLYSFAVERKKEDIYILNRNRLQCTLWRINNINFKVIFKLRGIRAQGIPGT